MRLAEPASALGGQDSGCTSGFSLLADGVNAERDACRRRANLNPLVADEIGPSAARRTRASNPTATAVMPPPQRHLIGYRQIQLPRASHRGLEEAIRAARCRLPPPARARRRGGAAACLAMWHWYRRWPLEIRRGGVEPGVRGDDAAMGLESLDVAPTTMAQYRSLVRCHIVPRWGTLALEEISGLDARMWALALRNRYADAADATVATVMKLLADAVQERLIARHRVAQYQRWRGRAPSLRSPLPPCASARRPRHPHACSADVAGTIAGVHPSLASLF